jgi:hypothetical protein
MRRRTLLGVSVAAGALLALAGGGAALLYERGWHNGKLLPAGREVLAAVARAVLDGSLPSDAAAQASAVEAHLTRIEATVAAMPAHTQGELADLLALLALPPSRTALFGLSSAWTDAPLADLQAALQSMRRSPLLLKRQAYNALRDLTHAAYFADASTWPLLRYPGPRALV